MKNSEIMRAVALEAGASEMAIQLSEVMVRMQSGPTAEWLDKEIPPEALEAAFEEQRRTCAMMKKLVSAIHNKSEN